MSVDELWAYAWGLVSGMVLAIPIFLAAYRQVLRRYGRHS